VDFCSTKDPSYPTVALVGKGVCFDTGGLSMKSPMGMLSMKKDMGGAAHVIGLARLILSQDLPVNLRVLVPCVENNVDAASIRPLDVVTSLSGATAEIGNTDAEGRLVLADALSLAAAREPDLLVDFATLTGAARVALGSAVGAFFCNCDSLASEISRAAAEQRDPLWRLPLYEGYDKRLESKIADRRNVPGDGGAGGAITAALFLRGFAEGRKGGEGEGEGGVRRKQRWVHFDVDGMPGGKPDVSGMRAMFEVIKGLEKSE
jgi:leucyl aminopeptidase